MTVHTVTPILAARDRLPSAATHGRLEHGLMVCLGLLASDPERFAPAAVGWHARLCAWLPGIEFSESQAALKGLGPPPIAPGAKQGPRQPLTGA